jgi:SNF2 family DNA or RNA helicase
VHLHKHQVDAVNELRRRWARGESLLLADDSGLGKSTSFIAFVQSLRCASACARPLCL